MPRKTAPNLIYPYTTKKDGKEKTWVLQAAVISGLRRMSYRTPMRAAALDKARVKRGVYKCAKCKKQFKKKDIAIDHVAPVIDVKTGFTSFDKYIKRLFCHDKGLQVLCNTGKDSCHKIKTKKENATRRKNKNESKR